MQPQVGAALSIIKKNGGRISHTDFLESMGYDPTDPRGSDIIKKIVYRTRHALFLNERGYLTLTRTMTDIPDDELQEAVEALTGSFRRSERRQESTKIWIAFAIAFIVGFLFAFYFTDTVIENDLSNLPLCHVSEKQ